MSKFIIIDGTALVFRGFYGMPHLTTSDGTLINAIYGFYSILLTLLIQEQPEYFAVCFDRKEETTRKKEFEDYKATRTKAPDELYSQIAPIKKMLIEGELNLVEKAGIEADDLIATLAKDNEQNPDIQILIYSSDLDLIQLVNDIKILKPGTAKTGNILMGIPEVIKKYGFGPEFIPDYKGLHGDPSDNLPGIPGVGTKTATKLIQEFGTLEDIYNSIEKIKGSLKEKLITFKDQAFFCRKLATLHANIEIETDLKNYKLTKINFEELKKLFQKYEFNKLIHKLSKLEKISEKFQTKNEQISLF